MDSEPLNFTITSEEDAPLAGALVGPGNAELTLQGMLGELHRSTQSYDDWREWIGSFIVKELSSAPETRIPMKFLNLFCNRIGVQTHSMLDRSLVTTLFYPSSNMDADPDLKRSIDSNIRWQRTLVALRALPSQANFTGFQPGEGISRLYPNPVGDARTFTVGITAEFGGLSVEESVAKLAPGLAEPLSTALSVIAIRVPGLGLTGQALILDDNTRVWTAKLAALLYRQPPRRDGKGSTDSGVDAQEVNRIINVFHSMVRGRVQPTQRRII